MRVAVVGGGIAGIAIAERLQRCKGVDVQLFERAHQLGTMSSGQQHGWFHAGNLYSLNGGNETVASAKRNVDILAEYYGDFPANAVGKGRWFRRNLVEYRFKIEASESIKILESTTNGSLANFICAASSLRYIDWTAEFSKRESCEQRWIGISSADRPMNTSAIMSSLLESFLSFGGQLQLGQEVSRYESEGAAMRIYVGEHLVGIYDQVILATGNSRPASNVEVRYSPLIVAYPRLTKQSFVIAESDTASSLTHITHTIRNKHYSVFSGSHSCNAFDLAAQGHCITSLRTTIKQLFGATAFESRMLSFFGYKVDVPTEGGSRNYSPQITRLEKGVLHCTPGKFSFGFLLGQRVIENLGLDRAQIKPHPVRISSVDHFIATPMHLRVAETLIWRKKKAG